MSLILLIVVLLLIGGGGWGYHTGAVTLGSPIGLILLIVVLVILFAGLAPTLGFYRW